MPDSPEIVEFRGLFARLKTQCEDEPARLRELALADKDIEKLCLSILKVAGAIQRSEQAGRDHFTGPVDPGFIRDWRDFEERFAAPLLDINISTAAPEDLYSFEYYARPDHWVIADFKAITSARALDAAIMFATDKARYGASLAWAEINVNAFTGKLRRAYEKLARLESEIQDRIESILDAERDRIGLSDDYLNSVRSFLNEHLGETQREHAALGAFAFWEELKARSRLDIRGILRRRALIPFVLFPRHVTESINNSGLLPVYQNLREAHDAFTFGVPFAALALMRSVMEMILRDHYQAVGEDLAERINSANDRLPKRANAEALHRLRVFANKVLHGSSMRTVPELPATQRKLERGIVSLFFVLQALVEGAPQSR